MMLVTPYGVDGEQRVTAGSRDFKSRERRSRSLSSFTSVPRQAPRDPYRKIPGLFCSGHRHSLHAFHSLLPTGIRASAVSPTTSVANVTEAIHFGRQWRVNAKTEGTRGSAILMTRCNACQLSSVPSLCIMHATSDTRCCKNVS